MGLVKNSLLSIGSGYPKNTGRLKHVFGNSEDVPKKVALIGDSTLDNGYWVDKRKHYAEKTHTVTHQTAVALAHNETTGSYDIGNFAVDGATTGDLMHHCSLAKVLPQDMDHNGSYVHQLNSVAEWKPDVVVLSVGGNNYREALAIALMEEMNYFQLFLRLTPEQAKRGINLSFDQVKRKILNDYKKIIDELIYPQLSRIVLLSQYFPSITKLTPYFIYTGFSHLARAEGRGRGPFTLVEETMNELYREILVYAATKEKEIVFVDVTSSLNPLGGKHTLQIEPNEQGSVIIGRLIADAVNYNFPEHQAEQDKTIAKIYLDADERQIQSQILKKEDIEKFSVKKIGQFINENRYRHLRLLFSPSSNLDVRFESTYDAITGKQFDDEYAGFPALGLLDITLVPVMASYLWRIALNEKVHTLLRVITGSIAAPILLSKMVIGLSLTLALTLPILGLHTIMSFFSQYK